MGKGMSVVVGVVNVDEGKGHDDTSFGARLRHIILWCLARNVDRPGTVFCK